MNESHFLLKTLASKETFLLTACTFQALLSRVYALESETPATAQSRTSAGCSVFRRRGCAMVSARCTSAAAPMKSWRSSSTISCPMPTNPSASGSSLSSWRSRRKAGQRSRILLKNCKKTPRTDPSPVLFLFSPNFSIKICLLFSRTASAHHVKILIYGSRECAACENSLNLFLINSIIPLLRF